MTAENGEFCGHLARRILFVAAATGVYGAVLAVWRSPLMAAYVAAKLPAVFVGATISGSKLSAARIAVLGLVFTATLGSLLAALSPILWLFSVSTENIAFTTCLSCALAALALAFVVRPIAAVAQKGIVAKTAGLNIWLVVFAIVALQTVTLVRPMLAPIGGPREPDGKCFFLMHFGKSVGLSAATAR